jgi:predicted ester cyclase
VNAEADDDPDDVGRQLPGPAGFLATSQWLRDAFSDLRFELHETVAEEGVVMAAATMTGEHTGTFNGIEPTGKRISHTAGAHFHGRWWPDHPAPRRP